jgi:SAM-dependent methyltransferase
MIRSLFSRLFALRNVLDYPLRQRIRLRRPGLHFHNEGKDALFDDLSAHDSQQAEEVANHLRDIYHLEPLYANSSVTNYRENLYYLELLEKALESASPDWPLKVDAADIGPSSWFYVQAYYALLRWWKHETGREVHLTGFEIDAYRVYADFRSRYDHALAHLHDLPGVHYLAQPFERQPTKYDLITELFPFVFLPDHLNWGLPQTLFYPQKLLESAWQSLKPGGVLILINQGEEEHNAQVKMLKELDILPIAAFRHDSTLFHYDLPRFALVVRNGS